MTAVHKLKPILNYNLNIFTYKPISLIFIIHKFKRIIIWSQLLCIFFLIRKKKKKKNEMNFPNHIFYNAHQPRSEGKQSLSLKKGQYQPVLSL